MFFRSLCSSHKAGTNMPLLFAVTPLRHNIEGGIEICCYVNIKNMPKNTKILLIKHKNK